MQDFIPILGYVLAAAMGALAFSAWRRSQGLHDLLVEAANRFELSRRHVQQLEHDTAKLSEKLVLARDSAQKHANALDDLRQKHQQQVTELQNKLEDITTKHSKHDAKVEHLEQQTQALTKQLSEADRECKNLKTQVTELTSKCQQLTQQVDEHKKSKAGAAAADPAEVEALKRRLAHSEHLYMSLRGLREMTEERNQNWERAIRLMAAAILQQPIQDQSGPKKAVIGQLIGAALEKIGARLVDDDEGETTKHEHDVERPAAAPDRTASRTP